jgi:hypothetical protein
VARPVTVNVMHFHESKNRVNYGTEIQTERLSLRRYRLDEWAALQSLANDPAIAVTTLTMPFPYSAEFAKQYLV